jgi:hypothetical protein
MALYPAVGLVTGPNKKRLRVGLVIETMLGAQPDIRRSAPPPRTPPS